MDIYKATPRPWHYGIGNAANSIFDANGAKVCEVYHNLSDRFAIVKAVNLFVELVNALGLIRAFAIPGMNWTDETGQEILDIVDKVLAKAKED